MAPLVTMKASTAVAKVMRAAMAAPTAVPISARARPNNAAARTAVRRLRPRGRCSSVMSS